MLNLQMLTEFTPSHNLQGSGEEEEKHQNQVPLCLHQTHVFFSVPSIGSDTGETHSPSGLSFPIYKMGGGDN